MQVVVKLFALYRQIVGASQVCLELPDGATVTELCQEMRQLYPNLPPEHYPLVVAVDLVYVDDTFVLHEGQEIALIPPVSGGMR